jgi:hypothetical protein
VAEFNSRVKTERNDWRTFKQVQAIRRVPDGYWGQDYSSFIPDHPYGSHLAHPALRQADARWLALLNRLSGGRIPANANNWNATKHPYFAAQDYKTMAGLKPFLLLDQYGSFNEKKTKIPYLDLVK